MLDTVDEGGGILNYPTELLLASGDFDTSSPWTLFETCVDGQLFQRPLTPGESTWRSALLLNRSTRNPLTDPTYHEAMRSGERKEWEDEMASEIGQLTNHGTIKATEFRRKGSEEERWNMEEVAKMQGLPWQPTGTVRRRPGEEQEIPQQEDEHLDPCPRGRLC